MSDDEKFQSAQKQTDMQILQVATSIKYQSQSKIKKQQNPINWKYQTIKKTINNNNFNKNTLKNISFQSDQLDCDNISDHNSIQEFKSSLSMNYSQCQQLYSKKKLFGVNWIGNQQYYASIFIDPYRIQKNDNNNQFTAFSLTQNIQQIKTDQIQFDSAFESGNLFSVFKIGTYQYDLLMQNDINTKGNTQWFYFRINNIPHNQDIKINIVNMMKADSLFNYGMLPCVHSAQGEKKFGLGWSRQGTQVSYFRNTNKIQNSRKYYHTLSFIVSTPYPNDTLRIAQCYPYTLSDLNHYLSKTVKLHDKKNIIQRQSLGQTLGKNAIQLIIIKEINPRLTKRQIIIIFARQHPGETPSSYVCEGIIDFLLSNDKEAEYLRKNFDIRIFPIVNPDGVYVGNYRTNLLGVDLNRRWEGFQKDKSFLESIIIKNYLNELSKTNKISFFLDLHGHSRKLFSFFYANSSNLDPSQVRMFPYLCSKLAPDFIRFEDSTFSYEESKRKTARVQLSLMLKIPYIFTFQVSFFGYLTKDMQKKHFTQDTYRRLGNFLCKGLIIHLKHKSCQQSKQAQLYRKLLADLKSQPNLLKSQDNSGSQSNPSQCQILEKDQKKLKETDQYSQQNKKINKKFVKKIIRKQIIVKQITRSTRQMHIIDMARVNSIFPNDILALVPSSFLTKTKKQSVDVGIQTDYTLFFKIYQACKYEELYQNFNARGSSLLSQKKIQKIQKNFNLFKTIIRPRSSTHNCIQILCNNGMINSKNYRQIKQIKHLRQQSGISMKSKKLLGISKNTQTHMTFPPRLLLNPMEQVDKNPEMSYSTISQSTKTKAESIKSNSSFKIGLRAINIQIWRNKRIIE